MSSPKKSAEESIVASKVAEKEAAEVNEAGAEAEEAESNEAEAASENEEEEEQPKKKSKGAKGKAQPVGQEKTNRREGASGQRAIEALPRLTARFCLWLWTVAH